MRRPRPDRPLVERVRDALLEGMDNRRELVAYSRLEALEMDRRARDVERAALDQVREMLGAVVTDPVLEQVRVRLVRMDEQLEALRGRDDIQDRSRALEQDDITWRTFEDVAWLVGIR